MSKKGKYKGAVEDDNIDELPEDFWEKSEPGHILLPRIMGKKNAEKLMSGKAGRPVAEKHAVRTSIRLWPEVDAYFRSLGKGWQTQVNRALKEWVEAHS